ncbi:class I SAM-dependent methyltransferase [Streptomyces sp. NPDC056352]|uniref:class I SAM-dependent methyltransferase n=1 Tax=Streptomyces sp. NPDC056352 TaxID=3345791 RepID=UPI0035E0437A
MHEPFTNRPAHTDRPAMLAPAGDVAGLKILDVGCGAGHYAAELLAGGAEVVGIDGSATLLSHARERLGDRGELRMHDAEKPLAINCQRMPLETFLNELPAAGLMLEGFVEPRPTPGLRELDETAYNKLHQAPCFIAVRLLRPDSTQSVASPANAHGHCPVSQAPELVTREYASSPVSTP